MARSKISQDSTSGQRGVVCVVCWNHEKMMLFCSWDLRKIALWVITCRSQIENHMLLHYSGWSTWLCIIFLFIKCASEQRMVGVKQKSVLNINCMVKKCNIPMPCTASSWVFGASEPWRWHGLRMPRMTTPTHFFDSDDGVYSFSSVMVRSFIYLFIFMCGCLTFLSLTLCHTQTLDKLCMHHLHTCARVCT